MAVLRKKVFGEVIGKTGNAVGRIFNGKNILVAAPSKYTPSQEPHEVDKRNRFGVNGRFAKVVKENELLYRVWEKEKAPATSAYNKICKVNFKLCGTDRPTEDNVITPGGFKLRVTDINTGPDSISVTIEPFDMTDKEAAVIFIMMVSFYEPKREGIDYYELCSLADYDIDGLNLKFKFDVDEKRLAEIYKNRTVYLAVVTVAEDGNVVRWSETVGVE